MARTFALNFRSFAVQARLTSSLATTSTRAHPRIAHLSSQAMLKQPDIHDSRLSHLEDVFGPRPPPGYSSLRAPPSQVLLPLTVSNKCGQAFRWRSAEVWDPVIPPAPGLKPDIDEKPSLVSQLNGNSIAAAVAETSTQPTLAASAEPELAWQQQTEWSLCLSDRVVLLRQDEQRGFIYHKTLLPASDSSVTLDDVDRKTERWLRDYLHLEVPLEALYLEWADKDKVFARFAYRFTGLRMLRQDPWECLCAFICSSNNNIARIGQMVQKLCTHFSSPLLSHTYPARPFLPSSHLPTTKTEDDAAIETATTTIDFHPFPPPERLAEDGIEEKLRELGFGYRAKYIATTARMLCAKHRRVHDATADEVRWDYGVKSEDALPPFASIVEASTSPLNAMDTNDGLKPSPKKRRKAAATSPEVTKAESIRDADIDMGSPSPHSVRSYLQSLRQLGYHDARRELLQFPGIGPKVADCILLMSLDQPSSIPVDRHVFQFAARWYAIRSKRYEDIAQHFRELWGEYAGWAHSVLFTADLRSFATYNMGKKEDEEEFSLPDVPKKEERIGKEEDGLEDVPMLSPSTSSPRKRKAATAGQVKAKDVKVDSAPSTARIYSWYVRSVPSP